MKIVPSHENQHVNHNIQLFVTVTTMRLDRKAD
jgi:hypothetical protein